MYDQNPHCMDLGTVLYRYVYTLVPMFTPTHNNNIKKSIFSFLQKQAFKASTHLLYLLNSIKYACSFNNHGVDLLVSGESSRARNAF